MSSAYCQRGRHWKAKNRGSYWLDSLLLIDTDYCRSLTDQDASKMANSTPEEGMGQSEQHRTKVTFVLRFSRQKVNLANELLPFTPVTPPPVVVVALRPRPWGRLYIRPVNEEHDGVSLFRVIYVRLTLVSATNSERLLRLCSRQPSVVRLHDSAKKKEKG